MYFHNWINNLDQVLNNLMQMEIQYLFKECLTALIYFGKLYLIKQVSEQIYIKLEKL